MPQLAPPRAPGLPLAPVEYAKLQQDQLNNALRLYFNQLDATFQQLLLGFNHYGTFYDTTTQSAAIINTAYPVTLNSTAEAFGVALDTTDTSRVYVNRKGVYKFQFSAQLDHVGVGKVDFYFWFRKNGVDIPASATKVVVAGPTDEIATARSYLTTMQSGDYFQLVWSANDTAARLLAVTAAAPVPAIPSVILTVAYVYPNAASL